MSKEAMAAAITARLAVLVEATQEDAEQLAKALKSQIAAVERRVEQDPQVAE